MSSSKKQHGSRNPVDELLASLVSLLQEANEKYDKLKPLYHLKNTYDELYQTHLKLQNSLCESCKHQKEKMETPWNCVTRAR